MFFKMGYADITQTGKGIHTRQYSRSFIIEGDSRNRLVFVSVDSGMMGHSLKLEVVEKLQKLFGNVYKLENIMISGTHTHNTPGGFLDYMLYDISIQGHVKQTFDALRDGITLVRNNTYYSKYF